VAQQRWDPGKQGNAQILAERKKLIRDLLEEAFLLPLASKSVLDIGCGNGSQLIQMLEWGADPSRLYGIDLLPHLIEEANLRHPLVNFDCANAECLPFADETMDVILLFTVLSSILDDATRRRVCLEASRVLKSGGAILWYDMRYRSLRNAHVRPISRRELRMLFPGFQGIVRSLTFLPPLARALGRFMRGGYQVGAAIPFLRSHYLALLIKP
jgi:ubiquinone/menaquinone biosynthesis C-methylase UbiE